MYKNDKTSFKNKIGSMLIQQCPNYIFCQRYYLIILTVGSPTYNLAKWFPQKFENLPKNQLSCSAENSEKNRTTGWQNLDIL